MLALYYLTFSQPDEAQAVAYDLLRERIAVCANWFPITCAYLWEGSVQQESETVLIVKARAGMRERLKPSPAATSTTRTSSAKSRLPA
jgi:periplasmic divalent cation tolerance protein